MSSDEKKLTRRQLYDLVWSIPITRLSKKYGLSDVGFAKICKKYNIPRPPRGYWARIASGQKLKKAPLSPGISEQIIELPSNPSSTKKERAMAEALEGNPFHTAIVVPETLRGAHSLVRHSAGILKSTDTDHLGLLTPPKGECLDINVSRKSLRRALLIMDGLIKALEGSGYEVFLTAESTQVRLLDVTLKISMSEETMTIHKEPKKHNLDGYYHFGHSRFDTERVPSGNLCLTIDEHFWRWSDHYRKNWRDTKKKRLEDQLHNFAKGLLSSAAKKKAYVQEEEEKQRKIRELEIQQQERERIKAERIEQQKQEQQRVSRLLADAENWKQSLLLRQYIAEVERRSEDGDTIGVPEGNMEEWLSWAHQQADRLDPFTENPPSIRDEEIEEEKKPEHPYPRW
jgi:hypothetical protein